MKVIRRTIFNVDEQSIDVKQVAKILLFGQWFQFLPALGLPSGQQKVHISAQNRVLKGVTGGNRKRFDLDFYAPEAGRRTLLG